MVKEEKNDFNRSRKVMNQSVKVERKKVEPFVPVQVPTRDRKVEKREEEVSIKTAHTNKEIEIQI